MANIEEKKNYDVVSIMSSFLFIQMFELILVWTGDEHFHRFELETTNFSFNELTPTPPDS